MWHHPVLVESAGKRKKRKVNTCCCEIVCLCRYFAQTRYNYFWMVVCCTCMSVALRNLELEHVDVVKSQVCVLVLVQRPIDRWCNGLCTAAYIISPDTVSVILMQPCRWQTCYICYISICLRPLSRRPLFPFYGVANPSNHSRHWLVVICCSLQEYITFKCFHILAIIYEVDL